MRFKTQMSSGWMAGCDEDPQRALPPDLCRGQYLCDVCEEVMTDDVLPAAESPSGLELAICPRCRGRVRRP